MNERLLAISLAGTAVGVVTGSWWLGTFAAVLVVVGIVGYEQEWGQKAWPWLERFGRWVQSLIVKAEEATAVLAPYDLLLGHDPITGEADMENLADLGHIGVYGTTRFGKTTWLHSIIHWLIRHHSANELWLYISDPKEVDYSFYSRLPYLRLPIARDAEETEALVNHAYQEMLRRARLFGRYAESHVCNNIHRYYELSHERLPWVLLIFDELADVVEPGSQLESTLVRIGKKGFAFGIQLVCATQRPSSKVVTGEIKSQMASKFSTWMPTAREYGVVAEIPKEMYQAMPRAKGRFMAYTSKGWRFIQGVKIPDRELERTARQRAGRPRQWPQPPQSTASWEDMGEADKVRAIQQLAKDLGKRPSLNQIEKRFGISRPTAIKYRKMAEG